MIAAKELSSSLARSLPESMSTARSVVSWLEGSKSPDPPDLLLHPADVFPLATLSNPPSSTDSDLDSDIDSDIDIGIDVVSNNHQHRNGFRHAGRNVASLVHPPTPKSMEDQATAAHARRRSSSLAGASVPSHAQHADRKRRRRKSDNILEEGEDAPYDSDSASSTWTDSDHLELDNMSADGLQDDEETGLTGRDRRRRRRRKRRNTLLDQRVVPNEVHITKEEEKIANQNVIQSMLINGVLIGLWWVPPFPPSAAPLTPAGTSSPSPYPSTTNGCSKRKRVTARPRTSFPFHFSPRVCIWWFNSRSHRSFCSLYPRSDLDTILSILMLPAPARNRWIRRSRS